MFPAAIPYLAEAAGAFAFILAIFLSGGNPLIIGGALAAVVFLIGPVSGAHVNPAVSAAMMLDGAISPIKFAGYVLAQLLGAVAAYYAYRR